jgi:hypothetical protein
LSFWDYVKESRTFIIAGIIAAIIGILITIFYGK